MSTLATLLKTQTTKDVTTFLQEIIGNDTTHGPLMWGGRIYRWAASLKTGGDSALTLLRTVVMADSAHILAELSDPTNDLVIKVFRDVPGMIDSTDSTGWSSVDYARWLFDKNTSFTEGLPDGEHSRALGLLTDYVAGDLHDTRELLHAITSRVWRNLSDESHNSLRLATFVLHTYAIYYNGWSPEGLKPNGLKNLHHQYLAGKPIEMAGETEWDNPVWKSPDDMEHSPFTIHTPFTEDFLAENGATPIDTWKVTIGDDIIRFNDYNEHGVAITTRVGDDILVHFLGFPMSYNSVISMAFEIKTYGDDYLRYLREEDNADSDYESIDDSDIVSVADTEESDDVECKESFINEVQFHDEHQEKQHDKVIGKWMDDGTPHSHITCV
mgnify:CR=1 FL=1